MPKKNVDKAMAEAAALLGRRGGQKRVPKGLARVSRKRRAEIVRAGAKARWDAYFKAHPEKRAAKRTRKGSIQQ
jgi:hypothetical protein